MVEAAIYRVSYEVDRGELYVRAFGRDVEGKRVDVRISKTEPYLFVLESEVDKIRGLPEVVKVLPGPPDPQGRRMVKVVTRYPFDVPKVRDRLSFHCEADVVYSVRSRGEYHLNYLDLPPTNGAIPASSLRPLSVKPNVTPRTLSFDLEVEDQFGFARPEKPENPVLSVGFYDSYKKAFGCIYAGPELDPEAVRTEMQAQIPESLGIRIDEPIRLFPMNSEHDVLGGFGDLLAKMEPDILSAYNGEHYDFPYAAGRAEKLLEREPTNRDIIRVYESFDEHQSKNRGRYALADPLAIFRKQELRQRSFSLESVATDFLGYGKIKRPGTVGELRRTDPVKFVAYNLFDVHLLERIDRKKKLIDYALKIAALGNVELQDIYHNSRVVDGVLFAVARETGTVEIALPSSSFAPTMQRIGKGAQVFPVIAGLHLAVAAIDFAEEYPALTQTFNIGPETRVPPETPDSYVLPTGGCYRKEPKGIVYRGLSKMRVSRKEAKAESRKHPLGAPEREEADTVSKAIKFVINSVDGVLGSKHSRIGSVEMFEDVTGMARLQLQWKKRHLEDKQWLSNVLGFECHGVVVAGDTDSTYVKFYDTNAQIVDLDRLNGEVVPKVLDALNASYAEFVGACGATENFTMDSVEGIFERLRTLPAAGSGDSEEGAKKRYFGLYAFDENKDVRGLPFARRVKYSGIEIKRHNNAPITKRVQTRIVELVLTGRPTSDTIAYLDEVRVEVLAGKCDEELFIPVSLSKARHLYESVSDFVRAIDNYQSLTGRVVFPGDEFRWVFVKNGVLYSKATKGSGGEDFEEFAIPYSMTIQEAHAAGFSFMIDRARMVEKAIDGPARNVAPEIDGSTPGMGEEW